MDTSEIAQLAGEVAASVEQQIENAEHRADDIVDMAVGAIDRAHEQNEELMRAAMETHLGQRIAGLEARENEWQNSHAEMQRQLSALTEQLATLAGQISATATLTVANALAEQDQSLSIPPNSSNQETLAEATETVTEVIPESLSEAIPAAPVVVAPARKPHRFL